MQAYKVKGKIDAAGQLVITEPIEMHPGDVEVILLQAPVDLENGSSQEESQGENRSRHCRAG